MRIWQLAGLGLLLCADGARAAVDQAAVVRQQPARAVSLDISAQPLGDALAAFATQAGLQMVFYSSLGEGIRAPALKGRFTPEAALRRLLENTSLRYEFIDPQTVAIRTREPAGAPVAEAPSGATAANTALVLARAQEQEETAATPEREEHEGATSAADEVREVLVTGSRIRSLVGEQTAQPVLTITREDIERYGVSSLGELFGFIPQISAAETGQIVQPMTVGIPATNATANRVSATLRGAPAGGTLLLVNGRRVPKTGQAGLANGSADNEAYDLGGIPLAAVERIDVLLDGASAIYGADAVGGVINVILRERYRGTEARAGYENTFDTDAAVRTLSLTHGFSSGRFSAMAWASWEEANELKWADRDFLRSFDRRFLGGRDLRSATLFAGRGTISSLSGNLPGLGVNQVAIPAGSNGVNVTVADYASAGPLPPLFDQGDHLPYSTPYQRRSFSGSLDHELSPALTLFAEGRWSESRTQYAGAPLLATLTLPSSAPGNPFGVTVRLRKYFYDLPTPEQDMTTVSDSLVAGARGVFSGDWRYETSIQQVRATPELASSPAGLNLAKVVAALAGPNPPVLAYDSTRGVPANAAGTLEALTSPIPTAERSRTRTYDAQVSGPLFALPAGPAYISLGAEYREEHVAFPVPSGLSVQSSSRVVRGYVAEVRVPLISGREQWPLLDRLEISLAARRDDYSDFPAAISPRYSLLYRPFSGLMLRGSYGEGYKVATLAQRYAPSRSFTAFIVPGTEFDALRGGEPVVSPPEGTEIVQRGNPDLRPEQSENFTAGLVLEVPGVRGLSLSLDYYDTRYLDRVGSTGLSDRIVLLPESVMRGPNLPGDAPGWPGPVIGYDDIAFNIASDRIAGYDLGVKYRRATALGEWVAQATASRITLSETRSTPDSEASRTPRSVMPLRATASVAWLRDSFRTSLVCTYKGSYSGQAIAGGALADAAAPSALRWDWQGGYDIGRTRLTLTIFNLFNQDPPLLTGIYMPDNAVLDSRLRRYSLSLVREF